MTEDAKVWAVPFPLQKDQIGQWCWGPDCGKGSVGAIDLGPSMAVPCTEPVCPFMEKESDKPFGEDNEGNMVYLRKLKALP